MPTAPAPPDESRMSEDQRTFLSLVVMPLICGFLEASFIIGLPIDSLMYLEKVHHLEALANPPKGAQRYFLTSYLKKLGQDKQWAARAVKLLRDRSRKLNLAKKEAKASRGASHGS
jgi:hypothetical protein